MGSPTSSAAVSSTRRSGCPPSALSQVARRTAAAIVIAPKSRPVSDSVSIRSSSSSQSSAARRACSVPNKLRHRCHEGAQFTLGTRHQMLFQIHGCLPNCGKAGRDFSRFSLLPLPPLASQPPNRLPNTRKGHPSLETSRPIDRSDRLRDTLLEFPSRCILASNVVLGSPSRAAARFGPPTSRMPLLRIGRHTSG